MIIATFTQDKASRSEAIAKACRLTVLEKGSELHALMTNVPDYVDVNLAIVHPRVSISMDSEGNGTITAHKTTVCPQYVDTRSNVDVWLQKTDFYTGNMPDNRHIQVELGRDYHRIAHFLWDDEVLRNEDSAHVHREELGKTLRSLSKIEEALNPNVDWYSQVDRQIVLDELSRLNTGKRGEKSFVCDVSHFRVQEVQEAFCANALWPHELDRAQDIKEMVQKYEPKSQMDDKMDELVINEVVGNSLKKLFNFIYSGDTKDVQEARAYFVKDILLMAKQHGSWVANEFVESAFDRVMCSEGGKATHAKVMDLIDKGKFPLSVMREHYQQPTLSINTVTKHAAYTGFRDKVAISAFPPQWFETAFKDDLFEDDHEPLIRRVKKAVIADGERLSQAKLTADKKAAKEIVDRWSWLAKRDEGQCPKEILLAYNQPIKNKEGRVTYPGFSDSIDDTEDIVKDLTRGVLLRAISESPTKVKDAVNAYFDEGLDIDIDPFDLGAAIGVGEDNAYIDDIYFLLENPLRLTVELGVNMNAFAEMSHRIHKDIGNITQALGEYVEHKIEFTGVTKSPVTLKSFTFEPISDNVALLDQGVQQSNCVYSYLPRCLSGEVSIVSMLDKQGEKVATIELQYDHQSETISVEQALGYSNDTLSEDQDLAVEQYVELLNASPTLVRSFWEQNNADLAKDLEKKTTRFNTMANLSLVPFNTDAAFYAVGLLDKYVPGGIDKIIKPGSAMDVFIKGTEFGHHLEKLKTIANDHNVSLMAASRKYIGEIRINGDNIRTELPENKIKLSMN